jgi:lysozyme family protein
MASIDQTVTFILENEDAGLTGKVTSGPGWTCRWGIDSRFNPGLDIPNLSLNAARAIYADTYVAPFSAIADQDVQDRVCDMMVNPGFSAGGTCVQLAVKMLHPNIVVDGIVGHETITLLNGCAPTDIIPRIRMQRFIHYFENDQGPNLDGLLVRACR